MNMFGEVRLKALNSDGVNCRQCSAAPTVDPKMVHIHLNKRHVRDLAPVSKKTNGARHNTLLANQ